MLFHVGSLWRLGDAGYLPRLDRISSVSGGSITAGVLASRWRQLAFDGSGRVDRRSFEGAVADPIRKLAEKTIDVPAIAVGMVMPFVTANELLARSYRQVFGAVTLRDLPTRPEFVFDATNLQSGDLWRFSSRNEGDYRVGSRAQPDTPLARVVAASSAFPPELSPARLSYPEGALAGGADPDLSQPPYTTNVVLSDGGVYDNLGLEACWSHFKEVLISDAGGHINNAPRVPSLWPRQVLRVLHVIDNQVRDLRKRQAVLSFIDEQRTGTYWGIRSHVADFPLSDPIAQPAEDKVRALAGVATRLAKVTPDLQQQLINWGYVICDTAMRAHVIQGQPAGTLPYPDAGL